MVITRKDGYRIIRVNGLGAGRDHQARLSQGVLRDGTRGVLLTISQGESPRLKLFLHEGAAGWLHSALEDIMNELTEGAL